MRDILYCMPGPNFKNSPNYWSILYNLDFHRPGSFQICGFHYYRCGHECKLTFYRVQLAGVSITAKLWQTVHRVDPVHWQWGLAWDGARSPGRRNLSCLTRRQSRSWWSRWLIQYKEDNAHCVLIGQIYTLKLLIIDARRAEACISFFNVVI